MDEARSLAEQVGYPLLVKAAGGGGGRGIKRVHNGDELGDLLGLARSEAGAAFGDDRVYLEKLIDTARHIEVQIAADDHGAVVQLGERDCSVQRRFQKVVEEAPAPALSEETRHRLQRLGRGVRDPDRLSQPRYRGVRDRRRHGEPYFLEMNCRIQVEHPVTEAHHRPRPRRDAAADRLRPRR